MATEFTLREVSITYDKDSPADTGLGSFVVKAKVSFADGLGPIDVYLSPFEAREAIELLSAGVLDLIQDRYSGRVEGLDRLQPGLSLWYPSFREPPRPHPAELLTVVIVQDAIRRYRQHGRQAVIGYYSSAGNVDGQWYVFIIDANGHVLAHYSSEQIGQDVSGATDSTGYNYGPEFVSATEQGHWINYMCVNPETNKEERKHTWCILYDGLTFCSGWYE